MFITETIFPSDADSGAQAQKLVKFSLNFRAESITNPLQQARTQGYFATNPDYDSAKADAERADLRRRMSEIEAKLVQLGIPATAIYRIGVMQASLSGGQIVLTNGSLIDVSKPLYVPGVPPAPDSAGSGTPGTRPTWIDAEGSLTADPKDGDPDYIKTEVKVTFKTNGVPGLKSIAATFALDKDGRLKEVGTELTLFKKQIAESWARGVVTEVQFAVKATASSGVEKVELEAKLKAVLEADIGVPNTKLRFGTEVTPYIDAAGKVGVGLSFTLFKF